MVGCGTSLRHSPQGAEGMGTPHSELWLPTPAFITALWDPLLLLSPRYRAPPVFCPPKWSHNLSL